jgi:hypothetical protein
MAHRFLVRDAQRRVVFDSSLAVGGVPLGFYTVEPGGSTWEFPDFSGAGGYAISAGRTGGYVNYTTDNSPGHLRFVFHPFSEGQTVVLFAK